MQPNPLRLAVLLPLLLAALSMGQVRDATAQPLGSAAHTPVVARSTAQSPQLQLIDCTLSQLNACGNALNKCKTAAGTNKDDVAGCSKQMGGCIEGCGLIPRTCQWENLGNGVGRFTCGQPCRGGTC
jgi:hypothetical protein